jgi:hypothetical protein
MKALLLKIKELECVINNDKEKISRDREILEKHLIQPYFLGLTFLSSFIFTLSTTTKKPKNKLPRKSFFRKISELSRELMKHYSFFLPLLKS